MVNDFWHHNTLLFRRETLPCSLEKVVTPSQDHYVMGGKGATGGQRSVAQDGGQSAVPQEQ